MFRSDTLEWSQGQDMIFSQRDVRNSMAVNGKIVFSNGQSDKIYEYDPETEDFNEIGAWPMGPNEFAVAIWYNNF